MRIDTGRILFLLLFLILSAMSAMAGTVKGTVTDKATGEPLIGATVQVTGTAKGAVTDVNGNYSFELPDGTWSITVSYVGYKSMEMPAVTVKAEGVTLDFALDTDEQVLGEVVVAARRNLESERALQVERQKATLAIENMGAREMAVKGIGNVQEGVTKLTGISVADAGQLIVRGLGDRYSTTTLNGLPIASPNPDNKLIPLDLFPASTVQNITVSKVYDASVFADYSGAHIDISTKENTTDDFFSVGFGMGAHFGAMGRDFYQMDRGSLFKTSSLDRSIYDMSLTDFDNYVTQHNIFPTTFEVSRRAALPEFSGNIGAGKDIAVGKQTLSLLASFSISNERKVTDDAFYKTLEATGSVQDDFSYDEYAATLKLAALASASLTLRENDRVGYTFFYARDAEDAYQRREGEDAEGHQLIGSNDITHIYTLQNHQLNGLHHMGDAWELTWGASYGKTSSEEPDRRQVMFQKNTDGTLSLFKLNRQETMRYYGDLDEDEWVAGAALKYKWGGEDHVRLGFSYKDKNRDYMGTRFYYNVNRLNPAIDDVFHTDPFLNYDNVQNGTVVIERRMQPHDTYRAGMQIYAAYAQTDFHPLPSLLLNVGLRYELGKQWVQYAIEGQQKYQSRRDMDKHDLFPTVNLRYTINDHNNLRFALSRTVTRPSFIEMAPFLYQESYGAAQIRGNEELQNGYNYNLDIRYERFAENGDMFSLTGYYKHLDKPIERIQRLQGGATMHSFQNADQGMAAGIEAEARKTLAPDLKVAANVSYMYTNVKLPQGGAYTNKERSLQGASPILFNADLTYAPSFGEDRRLSLALLYNLQGRRIHAVGVSGLGDIKEQTRHTMNFRAAYNLNSHLSFSLQVDDLLNRAIIFKQDVPDTGGTVEVERFKEGANFQVGISYTL